MKENTLTTNSVLATWGEGCEEVRLALEALRSGKGDPSKLMERLIQGAVAAAHTQCGVFLNPGSSLTSEPKLDHTGRADERYLKAKSKAVVRDTEQAQKAVIEALGSGQRHKLDQALKSLIAESVEQTQIDWYQKDPNDFYNRIKGRTVDKTLTRLFQEIGF